MSSNVEREWFYYLKGRDLLLYQLLGGSSNERISQSGVMRSRGRELMYPNEDIADGLRIEYTSIDEPFLSEALETTTGVMSGTTIRFDNPDIINSVAGEWNSGGFASGDRIRVSGSASYDGDYTLDDPISGGTTTVAITAPDPVGNLVEEAAGERITITQIPLEDASPDETSHINLNRMLSLAVVDYVKAMLADNQGEIEKKEYYMKEFFSKLGDNESNKRKISMAFPYSPFAVR